MRNTKVYYFNGDDKEKTTMKIKVIAFTKDEIYHQVLKEMVKDKLAFESPKNTFHLIHPLEEMNRFARVVLDEN